MCRVPATAPDKRVYSYEVDFLDAPKIANKVHQMLKNLDGRLDIVIFCHGVINFMGGIDGNLPEWDLTQKVNVRATMQFLSIVMPFLRMTRGSATVLSSSAGEKPWPGHTIYNAAMASLNMMVRCAALENAHHHVRVNAVAPGYVRSFNARSNQEFQNSLTQ
jgi:NAD(P)-dependent dehydrogenase (short-subunit alcohol dehydrogenase family)